MKKTQLSRKEFLAASAGGVGTMAMLGVPFLSSCSSSDSAKKSTFTRENILTPILPKAVDGKPLKAALIGCGGRGTGAAFDFINAGDGLSVTVLADVFPEQLEVCRKALSEKGQTIEDANCFIGFDAYKEVMATDVDVVLLCTPPLFRPIHFAAAVAAGKHIFAEKPCAVDPTGARAILAASKQAQAKGLSVVSGTVRRYQEDVIETYKQVCNGAIGEITSAHVIRNSGALWSRKRQPGWSDTEYAMRNWVNFCWLSGDFIVEQFIHEVDLMLLYMDKMPTHAMAYGARQRRASGDQYDQIAVNYLYEGGLMTNCMSRQIAGCSGEFKVVIYGTEGFTDCYGTIYNPDGSVKWKYELPEGSNALGTAYVQEHIQLATAIRQDAAYSDVEALVKSTLVAIMGRMSSYSGKTVTWEEVMSSPLSLEPEKFDMNASMKLEDTPPVPGMATEQI